MSGMSRRSLIKIAGASGLAATLGLSSACTGVGGSSSGQEGGGTALRYAWWGNNVRQQNYTKAQEQFMASNADIKIQPEFADYTAYQERMTTQMAARNVPDIFWVPSPQVMSYFASDIYHDLEGIDTLSLEDYSAADLESFKLNGKLNTMPFGIFAPVVRFNQTFLDEDGVDLPEDGPGWSWDALSELAVDYSKENSKKRWALAYSLEHDLTFESWLRQHGEQLWTEDGQMGFTTDTVAGWINWWEKLRKAGATPSLSEQDGVAPDWPTIGEKVLGHFGNSNHIIDDAKQFPDYTFTLRHMPELPDAPAGYQFLYFPRMSIYSGIDEDKLAAAGSMINFNVNSVEMLKVVGLTMGAPVNPRVAEEVVEFATEDEKGMLKIIAEERAIERKPRYEAPPGTSTWRAVMARIGEEVALQGTSVGDAAAKFTTEVKAGIDRAA